MRTAAILLSVTIASFALPTTRDEPCQGMFGCNDHGDCAGSEEEGGFYCSCFPGWYGVRCQIPEDVWNNPGELIEKLCDSKVACSGHGSCSGSARDSSCVCLPGFTGARCQLSVN